MSLKIPSYQGCNVLVAGDVMLDTYWFGPAGRLSPEAPVPVVKVQEIEARPGGAANVAVNLAALGASTRLCGITGDDESARTLARLLGERGIEFERVITEQAPTTNKLRVLSRNQQMIRLDTEELPGANAGAGVAQRFAERVSAADAVVLSDYAKGALSAVSEMIEAARVHDVPVLVDPKGSDFARYYGATGLTPNLGEFEAVVGVCHTDEQLLERAVQICHAHDLQFLLVTRSERGMSLVTREGQAWHFPAEAREVYDVTGAGDTVIATMAAGLAIGALPADAASVANLAAGLVVGKLGVAPVTHLELQLALHRKGIGGLGILDQHQVVDIVREAQSRGERVVMTNGCFDILHAGHVAYLQEAKSLGQRLLVAVNDDDSVRRLKGSKRPLNQLHDRMTVLSGLAAVDWVVPFSQDTPEQLIAQVLPDVLVKGGDYQPEQIAGATSVIRHGGQVRVLRFLEGHSTSALIETIRKRGA